MILAGIDEAGYGPTLGPLVVSVSLFRLPDEVPGQLPESVPDLWKLLEPAVCRKPDGKRAPVDDSKKLFNQKKGLAGLEEGLLPFVRLREEKLPRDLRALLGCVARRGANAAEGSSLATVDADGYLEAYPWYRGRNVDLPVATFANVVERNAARLKEALACAQVELLGLAARPVEVLELNQDLEVAENKAQVSFDAAASFIRRLWKQFPDEPTEVMVDRQGGRTHYARVLFEKVRPLSIRIETETAELSAYTLRRRTRGGAPQPFRVSFATGCEERCLPVALASMLSKYLREAHMALFNRYWKELRADLKPTAGYAVDARRFLADISDLRERMGIDEAILIRRR